MDPVQSAWDELIEAGGRTAQTFGISRRFGQIYVHVFLSEKPQSLDDIANRLGISKANASTACRQMASWGVIRPFWKKGDRKDYYVAETDFRLIIRNNVLPVLTGKLESARTHLDHCLQAMETSVDGAENPAQADLRQKLLTAKRYRDRLAALLDNPLIRHLL